MTSPRAGVGKVQNAYAADGACRDSSGEMAIITRSCAHAVAELERRNL